MDDLSVVAQERGRKRHGELLPRVILEMSQKLPCLTDGVQSSTVTVIPIPWEPHSSKPQAVPDSAFAGDKRDRRISAILGDTAFGLAWLPSVYWHALAAG